MTETEKAWKLLFERVAAMKKPQCTERCVEKGERSRDCPLHGPQHFCNKCGYAGIDREHPGCNYLAALTWGEGVLP